jgi:PRC-barrel domain
LERFHPPPVIWQTQLGGSAMVAKATAHPDRRLISSEDVQGTEVYGPGNKAIGEIDHLLIEKVSGRVTYAVMSFGGFLGLGPNPLGSPQVRH